MPTLPRCRHASGPSKRLVPPALACLLLAALWPPGTGAQVHRCNAPDGTSIFTDRSCASLGASASLPAADSRRAGHASRMRCMGSIQDLMFEMSMAFDAGDANRLAGLYHWTGMSSSNAYATIERLDRMVSRPLVDIVPVMPAPPQPALPPQAPATGHALAVHPDHRAAAGEDDGEPYVETLARRYADAPDAVEVPAHTPPDPAPVTPTVPPPTSMPPAPSPPPQRPVGIKVVQTLTNGVTPTSTVFGLTRHYGCWWIRN